MNNREPSFLLDHKHTVESSNKSIVNIKDNKVKDISKHHNEQSLKPKRNNSVGKEMQSFTDTIKKQNRNKLSTSMNNGLAINASRN